jgi:hypothetical protein
LGVTGALEEVSFQWPALLLVQDGRCGSHLGIYFRRLSDKMPGSTGRIFLGGDWRKVPVDNQCRHLFKMASTAAILDLVSVDYLTNASVDWSDLFVAYWAWLEVGSCRWLALLLTQDGSHLGFGSRRLSDERLSWLVRFFGLACFAMLFLF